ncbi:MAG: tRNA threonylcarbamoyladenosine dehydratase [Clostridia bacterium]|nr:tRNA threonylcarbamoyladenosine dehydratase [Clostridia bacterium]
MARNWQQRQTRLIGEDKTDFLAGKRIMVCGLGGVGGNCCEALCRAGIGTLILIDNDDVNETNINRQDFATVETVGMKKTDAAEKRLHEINPELSCVLLDTFLTPENIPSILAEHKPDYVIDAIDNVTAKVSLAIECQKMEIPLIASMGTGNKLNPEMLKISDISKTSVCPLARVMRKKMKDLGVKKYLVLWSDELPITPEDGERTPASISFVPPCAGIMIAGRVIRNLLDM